MHIDNEIIYYLLKDIGVSIPKHSEVDGRNINAPIFARDGLHIPHFDHYFSVKKFESANERKMFNYSNGISTDGWNNPSWSTIAKGEGVPSFIWWVFVKS